MNMMCMTTSQLTDVLKSPSWPLGDTFQKHFRGISEDPETLKSLFEELDVLMKFSHRLEQSNSKVLCQNLVFITISK